VQSKWTVLVAIAVAGLGAFGLLVLLGGGDETRKPPPRTAAERGYDPLVDGPRPKGHAVEPDVGAPSVTEAELPPPDPEEHLARAPEGAKVSIGAPTDEEVKRELAQVSGGPGGRQARLLPSGEAVAPANAPAVVKQMIAAGNAIARKPYLWGGGHGRLYDRGYDCSGSLSFAFIHAGLLEKPIAHGWSTMGRPGPGKWVSVYSNAGHVFMVVAGLRYDTSAIHIAGSRWSDKPRSTAGFTVRHLPGL
jgi:hypothetical protein